MICIAFYRTFCLRHTHSLSLSLSNGRYSQTLQLQSCAIICSLTAFINQSLLNNEKIELIHRNKTTCHSIKYQLRSIVIYMTHSLLFAQWLSFVSYLWIDWIARNSLRCIHLTSSHGGTSRMSSKKFTAHTLHFLLIFLWMNFYAYHK